jgi:hypothetical protein
MRATRTMQSRGGNWHPYVLVVLCGLVVVSALGLSCSKAKEPASEPRIPIEFELPPYLIDTVAEVADVSGGEEILVQGLGFVTGLDRTGTKALPPGVRQQMLDIMRRNRVEHPEEIISSPDTAVVMVSGRLEPGIGQGEFFDLEVRAIPATEVTSLEGGFLLDCDLVRIVSARGIEAKSDVLAAGRGPVFVSPTVTNEKSKNAGDPRNGRVLAGGKDLKARQFQLILKDPSVRTAEHLVRIINTRFPETAKGGEDPGIIGLEVPRDFLDDKIHFLNLIGALYLRETGDARDLRLNLLIDALHAGKDLDRVALCLEAMGGAAVPRLRQLSDDKNPMVRFYAGRTLANLQDATAVHLLEPFALDDASSYQEYATESLGRLRSGVGMGILGRVLNAKNPRVRVAAWQAMVRLSPRQFVTRNFTDKFRVSYIPTKADPFIYISQTLKPEIAIFGAVEIKPPILAETRRVIATVKDGENVVKVVTRSHGEDTWVETPLDVRGFIEKVTRTPSPGAGPKPEGLDLTYSDVVGLLLQMSTRKSLTGPIVLQPLKLTVPSANTTRPVGEPEGLIIRTPDKATPSDNPKGRE